MLFDLITLAESVPLTGDDFPKGILIGVGIIAVAAAALTAILAKKKSDDDDNESDDEE